MKGDVCPLCIRHTCRHSVGSSAREGARALHSPEGGYCGQSPLRHFSSPLSSRPDRFAPPTPASGGDPLTGLETVLARLTPVDTEATERTVAILLGAREVRLIGGPARRIAPDA
jgi:hypothetical protein